MIDRMAFVLCFLLRLFTCFQNLSLQNCIIYIYTAFIFYLSKDLTNGLQRLDYLCMPGNYIALLAAAKSKQEMDDVP